VYYVRWRSVWWPWPLSAVQGWFENFYNSVQGWIWQAQGWLAGQISAWAGTIQGAVNASTGWLAGQFQAALGGLSANLTGALAGVQNLLQQIYGVWGEVIPAAITQPFNNLAVMVRSVSPEALMQQLQPHLNEVHAQLLKITSPHSSWEPAAAAQLVWGAYEGARNVLRVLAAVEIAGEALSLGQVDMALKVLEELPEVRWAKTFVDEYHKIVLEATVWTPLKKYYNMFTRPWLPSLDQLIDIATALGRDEKWVAGWAQWHGVADGWVHDLMVAAQKIPSRDELFEMMARGVLSRDQVADWLHKSGVRGELVQPLLALYDRIPGPSDLIRFVVREVISPDEFEQWMAKQRYSSYWARAYWDAHWELPSLGELREAFWRGVITSEEFRKFVVWHDYSPTPRPGVSKSDLDILFATQFKLPGRIDARWMLRWGIIGWNELLWLTRADGVDPAWAPKVAQAELLNMLLDERTALRSVYIKKYKLGFMTDDELRQKLRALYFCEEEIAWIVQRAREELELEVLDDLLSAALNAYRKDIMTEDELFTYLTQKLGMRPERAEALVRRESFKKLPRI